MKTKEECLEKLYFCFPGSFLNNYGEFIAHKDANSYFNFKNCETELDVKCKVLEWLSRDAYKSEPFDTWYKNDKFHQFILTGINMFLNTMFNENAMEVIYTYLGNCCNHQKTIRFIESNYDFDILAKKKEED